MVTIDNSKYNEAGEDVAVLVWETSSYVHSYRYEGLIDTEFIDEYECLILHGCNEFSVEICRTALDQWSGKVCGPEGKLIADMHIKNSHKREGLLLGAEYILSIHLLSKCN